MPAPPALLPRRSHAVFTAALVLVALLLGARNGLGRFDDAIADLLVRWAGRPPSERIVIVAADDRSIAAIGRWPWPRATHAKLIDRLARAQAKAVGLDLILSEPDVQRPGDDAQLADAMRRNGHVVLPVRLAEGAHGRVSPSLPIPVLAQAAAGLGHIHITVDEGGTVRRMPPLQRTPAVPWPHLSAALMSVKAGDAAGTTALIPFAGPPDHFTRVSYVDVLDGLVPDAVFRGRMVLVGVTAAGAGDAYATPSTDGDNLMPGVEVVANILDSLDRGVAWRKATRWENALYSAVPPLLLCMLLARMRPRGVPIALALILASFLAATYALQRLGVQMASLAGLLGAALAYPAWSWLRLESAMRYLAEESERTQRDIDLPGYPLPRPAMPAADPLERQIHALASASQGLRSMQRFVRDCLDGLPDAACITDLHGVVVLANVAAARWAGLGRPAELAGMPLLQALQAMRIDLERAAPDFYQAQVSPTGAWCATAECERELADTAGRAWLLKSVPRFDDRGVYAGSIVVLVDTTSIHQTERQRDDALRFISHDLRAPLSSILTLLELERQRGAGAMPSPQLLERIGRHARRSLELADSFMHMAQAESAVYPMEPTDLRDVVLDAVDQYWDEAQANQLSIDTALPDDPCLSLCNRALVTRAVGNLLGNAIKFSRGVPGASKVRCRIARADGHWRISVADDGVGIAAADQAACFEKFRRGAHRGGASREGAGLGLALVKAVVSRHGGTISVHSAPGEGAVFDVRLPVLAEH